MNTLQQFAEERLQVPLRVAWYLSDLVRARGVQDLFIKEVESACPGVCRDMVRKVLKDMKQHDKITCTGRGPAARWEKR